MTKPTIEEITDYLINEKKYDDFSAQGFAQSFFHYYESVGWKVGKNSMKSWHSAIATWEIRQKQKNATHQQSVNSSKSGNSALLERTKNLFNTKRA